MERGKNVRILKKQNGVIVLLLAIVLCFSACGQNKADGMGLTQKFLETMLSTSKADVETFNDIMAKANESGESEEVEKYFFNRLSEYATESCVKEMMADRSCAASIMLAEKNTCEIVVSNMDIKRTSEAEEVYVFTVDLLKKEDNNKIASAVGTVYLTDPNGMLIVEKATITVK